MFCIVQRGPTKETNGKNEPTKGVTTQSKSVHRAPAKGSNRQKDPKGAQPTNGACEEGPQNNPTHKWSPRKGVEYSKYKSP